MQAVYFGKNLSVVDVDVPFAKSGEALIKVHLAGICNTDLEITKGYMGFQGILGHEFVGTVVASADEAWCGTRVVGEINLGCRDCEQCRRGLARHCPNRSVLGILGKDGAMAEYLTLPIENLHRLPDSVADEQAVFVEPLAAAFEIAQQIHLPAGGAALVIGDGKLGLLVAQVLQNCGMRVTMLGRHENKLAIVRRRGVTVCQEGEKVAEKYDVVVEATGAGEALEFAISKTAPRGYLVLKSTYAGTVSLLTAPLVIDEIHLIGSRCGPFEPAIASLARTSIEVKSLVHSIHPLKDALKAFAQAREAGVLKVLLAMPGRPSGH